MGRRLGGGHCLLEGVPLNLEAALGHAWVGPLGLWEGNAVASRSSRWCFPSKLGEDTFTQHI